MYIYVSICILYSKLSDYIYILYACAFNVDKKNYLLLYKSYKRTVESWHWVYIGCFLWVFLSFFHCWQYARMGSRKSAIVFQSFWVLTKLENSLWFSPKLPIICWTCSSKSISPLITYHKHSKEYEYTLPDFMFRIVFRIIYPIHLIPENRNEELNHSRIYQNQNRFFY